MGTYGSKHPTMSDQRKFLESLPPVPIDHVTGNASSATKRLVAAWLRAFSSSGFAKDITGRLRLCDVSVVPKADAPERQEARIVLEIDVAEDMLNVGDKLHGGCIMHLADICSTVPLVALSHAQGGAGSPGVSQTINTIYHAPATLGDRLKLVATSMAIGGRTATARVDFWDTTHRRLVASATQVKMEPSSAKL